MGLRELRAERGLTLEALGVLGDVDAATISRIERGLSKGSPDVVVKLAKALGISATRMRRLVDQASAAA